MFSPETSGQADLGLKMMNILFCWVAAASCQVRAVPADEEAKPSLQSCSWVFPCCQMSVTSCYNFISLLSVQPGPEVWLGLTKTTCLEPGGARLCPVGVCSMTNSLPSSPVNVLLVLNRLPPLGVSWTRNQILSDNLNFGGHHWLHCSGTGVRVEVSVSCLLLWHNPYFTSRTDQSWQRRGRADQQLSAKLVLQVLIACIENSRILLCSNWDKCWQWWRLCCQVRSTTTTYTFVPKLCYHSIARLYV